MRAVSLAQGMAISRLPGERVRYEGNFQSRAQRLRISVSIAALRGLFWLSSTASQMWCNLTEALFGHRAPMLLLAD